MYTLYPVVAPEINDDWRAVLWSGNMALLSNRAEIAGDTLGDGDEAYLTFVCGPNTS
ncbi:MAG: hypothetical protein KDD78_05465 [Caldilineaceae bacterium]|nr:hypothetical protein [Caldilineaceae bacterium]